MPSVAPKRKKQQSNVIPFPSARIADPEPELGNNLNLNTFLCPDGGKLIRADHGQFYIETPTVIWWLIKQEVA